MAKHIELDRGAKISRTLSRTDFPVGVPANEDGLIHRSKRKGACQKVRDLCDKYIKGQGKDRAFILEKCRKLGISEHTARTEYAWWRNPPKKNKKKALKKAA